MVRPPSAAAFAASALLAAALVAPLGAAGCARHIDVIDRGSSPALDACVVSVDVESTGIGRRPGALVELYREETVVTSFPTRAEGPTEVVDLEPGRYRVVIHGPPDAPQTVITKRFRLAPGRSLALVYDDDEAARETWREVARCAIVITVEVGGRVLICCLRCCCRC